MPRITQTLPAWQTAVAFSVGALISVLLSRTVGRIRRSLGANTAQLRGAWMVYIAIATDLVSDGLMTGIGSAVSSKLGLLLALSQLVANIPGGFATGANFRHKGVDRKKRFLVAFSYPLPALVAASVGFFLLRHTGDVSKNLALAVIVGILLVTTAEDTIPQGDEPQPPRWISTSAFSIGFVMFVLFSTYFE
jgi:zinc transporter, ZIP family